MKAYLANGTIVEGTEEEIEILLKNMDWYEIIMKREQPTVSQLLNNPCEGCSIFEKSKQGKIIISDACCFCNRNPFRVISISLEN